jgi:hypothetical protein
MKKLEISQIENIAGGVDCRKASNTASVLGLISFGLTVVAVVATGPVGILLATSQSIVFGGVGLLVDGSARVYGCK